MKNYDAQLKAEEYVRYKCIDIDVSLDVRQITGISTRNINAGDEVIINLEKNLAHAIQKDDEDLIVEFKEEITTELTNMIKEYLESIQGVNDYEATRSRN